jgi:hypothetical protein
MFGNFYVFGVDSFFIGGLFDEPVCVFGVASFFIGGLFNEPICIFGLPLFLLEVFW